MSLKITSLRKETWFYLKSVLYLSAESLNIKTDVLPLKK